MPARNPWTGLEPAPPTVADLQAKLDAARMRLHEIVILR